MRIQFLGTGGAEGVPAMGCTCAHCSRARQGDGRLARRRSAVLFDIAGYRLLMDTPPDIRALLQLHDVRSVHGIFLTHEHFDHTGGLEEFLYWHEEVDLFVEPRVYQRLVRQSWGERLREVTFHVTFRPGVTIRFGRFFMTPFEVKHSVPCYGLAIYEGTRRVVHMADTGTRISNYVRTLVEGADVIIVNTPFFSPNGDRSHLSVEEAIAFKKSVGANRLVITHANHFNLPHDELEAYAQQFPGVVVAYDGMVMES